MAISKVIYKSSPQDTGTVLMDVTGNTNTAARMFSGDTGTANDGTGITGTYAASASITVESKTITDNGTYTAPSGTAYSPVIVNVSGGGSGSVSESDVNFIDYDGTLLYSYTASEIQTMTELPANPSHSGLTAQGWNWTLAEIRAQLAAQPDDPVTVGQMYITDDGNTRLYCTFEDGRLSPVLGICPNGTVTVDWGDGSATDTLTGTSLTTVKTASHTYAAAGSYVITLTVVSGSFAFYGGSSTSYILRKDSTTTANIHAVYTNALRRVELGTSVSIGSYAFSHCYSLASITIPSSVTSIGTYAFRNCYSLASITIPSGVTSIEGSAFSGCYSLASITIPSGVTSIGVNAFYACQSLASVTIPSGVTSIGSYAFQNCYSLSSITIPSGVTSIGANAFQNCYSLASITIPSGVTSIGVNAFYACQSLASITIPSGVTSIASNAFRNCYSLASITIPSGVTSIGSYAFYNCQSLASVTIPSGVTSIGSYAFQNCYSLSSITIPSGVTSIGSYAFYACYSLASVTIPSGVTSIGSYAFQNCYSLSSITIPSGVTSIEGSAFSGCYGMAEYHVQSTTPPTLSNTNAFTNIQSDCVIYVPQGCLEAYQTATNWSTYASYMQEEPQ